ncbi:RNA polymerase sigma factor SigZ [Colwellia piezophila]|uniref:RNA polymerase sigma factor SigZ n=1 Tax=Colwellia piezophila TaxID=211668 RepID=UPI00035D072C|nr:RNA polymerase sigma factor SigZ [Colwellia piezophila]
MKVEDIWLEYRAALKRFLHAKVANEADVDDLLQDILIKTYNNLDAVKTQKSVNSWLFQIANNTIIDYYRQKSRKNARAQVASDEEIFALEESPQSSVDLSNCISPFINALPDKDASLLTAIDLHNQSQKQYAQQMGISYSTLKSRVQKSRGLLKQVFDDCCHFKIDKIGNVYDYDVKNKKDKNCQ